MTDNPQPTIPSGEPLDRDTLMDFADVDLADIEQAAEWWDMYAGDGWVGVLDNEAVPD